MTQEERNEVITYLQNAKNDLEADWENGDISEDLWFGIGKLIDQLLGEEAE